MTPAVARDSEYFNYLQAAETEDDEELLLGEEADYPLIDHDLEYKDRVYNS